MQQKDRKSSVLLWGSWVLCSFGEIRLWGKTGRKEVLGDWKNGDKTSIWRKAKEWKSAPRSNHQPWLRFRSLSSLPLSLKPWFRNPLISILPFSSFLKVLTIELFFLLICNSFAGQSWMDNYFSFGGCHCSGPFRFSLFCFTCWKKHK